MKRKLFIPLLVGVVSMSSMSVGAAAMKEKITAELRKDVSVTLAGQKIDLQGKSAIMYEGTTYLPLRVVGDAFGQQAGWNNETATVSLIDKSLGAKVPVDTIDKRHYVNKTNIEDRTFGHPYSFYDEYILDFELKNPGKKTFNGSFYFEYGDEKVGLLTIKDITDPQNPIIICEEKVKTKEEVTVNLDTSKVGKIEVKFETKANVNTPAYMYNAYWE